MDWWDEISIIAGISFHIHSSMAVCSSRSGQHIFCWLSQGHVSTIELILREPPLAFQGKVIKQSTSIHYTQYTFKYSGAKIKMS